MTASAHVLVMAMSRTLWKKLDFLFRTSEPSVDCFECPDFTGVDAGVDAALLGVVVATKGAVFAGVPAAATGIELATALLGVVFPVDLELELAIVPAGPRPEVPGVVEAVDDGAAASTFELKASGLATAAPDGRPLIGAVLVDPVERG